MKVVSIITGVIMAAIGLILMFVNPVVVGTMPDGFITPIIALEFMNNTNDLYQFFNIVTVDDVKRSFQLGNQIDFLFMFAYGFFALFCGILMYQDSRAKALWLSIPLVALTIFSDTYENLNIAEILAMKDYDNATLILDQLQLYTWLKWGSLSAIMLLYSVYFFQGNWKKIILGIIMLSSFVFAIIAFFLRGVYCEIMSVNIMVCFVGLLVFAIFWRPSGESIDMESL